MARLKKPKKKITIGKKPLNRKPPKKPKKPMDKLKDMRKNRLFEAPNIIKVPGRKKPFINRFRAAGKKI
jgi:hypothetical protein